MSTQDRFNRREVMKTSVLALGSGLLMSDARQAYSKVVNTNSSPSALKVADLRVATIGDRTDSPSQSRPFYVTLPTGQKGVNPCESRQRSASRWSRPVHQHRSWIVVETS
jgi:hypothetical protein